MAITPKPAGTVSPPNSPTSESAGSVAVPNSPTGEAVGSVAVPNSPSAQSAGSVAVPNSPSAQSAGSVAVPNSPSAQAAGSVAIPNSPTAATVTVFPRTLCPKIGFDFADGAYSLCGQPKALSDITTYSRASSATFINRRVNNCTGRYEYFVDTDFVGTVTNLVTYSEQFDNADWEKQSSTVTANNELSPVNNRTADLITKTNGSENDRVRQTGLTISSSTVYTVSVHFKRAEFNNMEPAVNARVSGGTLNRMIFSLDTGAIITTIGNNATASVTSEGDGWYKASLTFLSDGTSVDVECDIDRSSVTTELNSVLIWGAQLTESAKPLPYVKTEATSDSDTFSESVRLEYDPATGDALGALIEGASTNLQIRSEEFDDAAWIKGSATITANDTKAPDSTTSADKVAADSTATIIPNVQDSITSTASSDYTISVYAKAAEASLLQIFWGSGHVTGNPRANFDLASGALGTVDSEVTATIQDAGNGWYRCTASVTAAGTTLQTFLGLIKSASDTRSQSNSWTAGDGLYLWGVQVEEQPFATSYIRTEGSTVSRVADDLTSDGSNAPIFNSDITIHCEFDAPEQNDASIPDTRVLFQLDPTGTSSITSSTGARLSVSDDLFHEADDNPSSALVEIASDVQLSTTLVISGNTATSYVDGALTDSFTSGTLSGAVNTIGIGREVNNAVRSLYGHIKELKIYDTALTATEVTQL